jgi:hypothetical protein
MSGVAFLTMMLGYVVILGLVTYFFYRWARRRAPQSALRWLAPLTAFLVLFLPVFGDAVPTLLTHRLYCEREAGFTLGKTIDDWLRENPGAVETSRSSGPAPQVHVAGTDMAYQLNNRARWEIRAETRPWGIHMREDRLVDSKNGEVLAKLVDFDTGVRNILVHGYESYRDIKMWMARSGCHDDSAQSGRPRFGLMMEQLESLGVKK